MIRKHFLFGFFVLALMTAFTVGLAAHLSVLKTMPADDTTVSPPPERVQVWFNQQPSPRISRLELRGPNSQEVDLGKLEVHGEDRSISAALPAPLPPGKYEATWRSAGDDGHVMRGTFTFTVGPAQ
jgi:methionine-rich copper-binding protein CopC